MLSHEDNRLMRSPGPKGYLKDHPRTCKYLEAIKRPLGRGISPSLGDETYHPGYFLHFLNGMILQESSTHGKSSQLGGGEFSLNFPPVFFGFKTARGVFAWVFDPLSGFV